VFENLTSPVGKRGARAKEKRNIRSDRSSEREKLVMANGGLPDHWECLQNLSCIGASSTKARSNRYPLFKSDARSSGGTKVSLKKMGCLVAKIAFVVRKIRIRRYDFDFS
jgi:hypothetical protein